MSQPERDDDALAEVTDLRLADRLLGALAGLALVALILELGFALRQWQELALGIFQCIVLAVLVSDSIRAHIQKSRPVTKPPDIFVILGLCLFWFASSYIVPRGMKDGHILCLRLAVLYFALSRMQYVMAGLGQVRVVKFLLGVLYMNSTFAIAMSFAVAILVGSLLLSLPCATASGRRMEFVDAFFTATSAVCVTGLIVKDTAVFFSTFGKCVILALIQIGGLGIMTISAFFILAMGRRLMINQKAVVREALDAQSIGEVRRSLRFIVTFTLIMEVVGTVLLSFRWIGEMPDFETTLLFSVFHSISAFCNAGFSLFSDSLVRYVGDPVVNLVVMGLIVAGGLGFFVFVDFWDKFRPGASQHPKSHLSLHTRTVLISTAVLIVLGTVLFFIFERKYTLAGLPLRGRLFASFFQAITPRTAGFNTVDIKAVAPSSTLLLMALMFVGGSPGSTAGGIKTSTAAIVVLTAYASLRGRNEVTWQGRTISNEVQRRALAIALAGLLILGIFAALLLALPSLDSGQPQGSFREVLFEAVSAFGTVGLSEGITPKLSTTGEILISLLMFIGRVGPLTIAVAIGGRGTPVKIKYPEERVMVG